MPEKPSPVTISVVAEPGKVSLYECSPPGSSGCESLLGDDLRKWRRISVSKTLLDPPDFGKDPERKYVEDWIVQLIENEVGKWLKLPKNMKRLEVKVEPPTAIAITEALLAKAKHKGECQSTGPSCQSDDGKCGSP